MNKKKGNLILKKLIFALLLSISCFTLFALTTNSFAYSEDNIGDYSVTPGISKDLPSVNNCNQVTLNKVGGMCYKSKNLLNTNNYINANLDVDGSIINANNRFLTDYISVVTDTTYTLSANANYGFIEIGYYNYNTFISISYVNNQDSYTFTTPLNCNAIRVGLQIASSDTSLITDTIVIERQTILNEGSTALDYVAYFEGIREVNIDHITFISQGNEPRFSSYISNDILNINGYGWGIDDTCYNYIDYTTKKFVQNVGKVDLGSLDWAYNSNFDNYVVSLPSAKKTTNGSIPFKGICSKYPVVGVNVTVIPKISGLWNNVLNGQLYIYDPSFGNNLQAFKTALNGQYLYYELDTPVETDISQYINIKNITYNYIISTRHYISAFRNGSYSYNKDYYKVPIYLNHYYANQDYISYINDSYTTLQQNYNTLQNDYASLQQDLSDMTDLKEYYENKYEETYNDYQVVQQQYEDLLINYNNLQTQFDTLQQQYNLLENQINGFYNTYKLLFNNAKCYAINSLDSLYGRDVAYQYANRNNINYEQTITIENNNINYLDLPSFYNYMSADYYDNNINEVYYVLYVLETYSDYSIFLDDLGENLTANLWANEISVLYENGFIVTGTAEQFNNTARYTYNINAIENNPIIAFRVSYNINPNSLATGCIVNLESSAMINNAYYQLGVSSLNQEIADKNVLIESLNANLSDLRIQYNTLREQYNLISNKPLDLNMRNLLWYIAETPFTSFKTIWNVDFLGLNLASFVTGLLSVWIVIFIIKKIFK